MMGIHGCRDCAYCSSDGSDRFCPAKVVADGGRDCRYWEWAHD